MSVPHGSGVRRRGGGDDPVDPPSERQTAGFGAVKEGAPPSPGAEEAVGAGRTLGAEDEESSGSSASGSSSGEGDDDEESSSGSYLGDIEIREALEILDMARVLHALETSVARLVEKGVLTRDDPIVQNIEIHTDGIAYYLSECGIEPDCSDFLDETPKEEEVGGDKPDGEKEGGTKEREGSDPHVDALENAAGKTFEEVDDLLTRAAETGYATLKGCIGLILGAIQRSIKHRKLAVGKQYEANSPDLSILDIPTIEYVLSDLEALGRVFKAKQFFPQTSEASPDTVVEAITQKMAQFWGEIRRRQRLEPQDDVERAQQLVEGDVPADASATGAGEAAASANTEAEKSKDSVESTGGSGGGSAQCALDPKKMTVHEKMESPLGNEIQITFEASSKSLNTVVSSTIRKLISFRQFGNEEVEMAVPRKRIIQALTKNILDQVTMKMEMGGETKSAPILELLPIFVGQINSEAKLRMAETMSAAPGGEPSVAETQ